MRFVAAAPYFSRLQPSGQTPPYTQSLGSYLLNGNLRDVTVGPDRTTVLALNLMSSSRRDEIAIVRLAP
jgi:hypothetical protein